MNNNAEIYEIENSVPSEVILPYIKDKTLIFFERCSTMLNLKDESTIVMLYLTDLNKSAKYKFGRYPAREDFIEHLRICGLHQYTIVDI